MANNGAPDKTWEFDPIANRYDQAVATGQGVHVQYDQVLRGVVKRAALNPGCRVLDIGTGTGNLAQLCAERGAEVEGVDPSVEMLRIARGKIGDGLTINYRHSPDPFRKLPYADGSFDVVLSSYAFHHVPPQDKPAAVAEMLRVLASPGRWVLGDLIFTNRRAETEALARYDWLEEEYFAYLDVLRATFRTHGLELHSWQLTPVTCVLWCEVGCPNNRRKQ